MAVQSFRSIVGASPSTATPVNSTLIIIDAQNEYAEGKLKVTNAAASRKAIASLLQKYRDEAPNVQNHLHVLSIIEAVYAKLGREKDSAENIAFEQILKSAPSFKRTREIIQKEGIDTFVAELRKTR